MMQRNRATYYVLTLFLTSMMALGSMVCAATAPVSPDSAVQQAQTEKNRNQSLPILLSISRTSMRITSQRARLTKKLLLW